MVYTQHFCAKCASDQLRRKGAHQLPVQPVQGLRPPGPLRAGSRGRAARYAQVEQLLVERNSQRSIVRAAGAARMTIARLLKKAQAASPPLPQLRPKKG